jgi:hypothetical protein
MAICATCHRAIKETVVQGRKFIANVPTGLHSPPGTGRYLTILNLTCECGILVERRYENRQTRELNHPEYQLQ